jgi:uracil-DNA glycosylase
MTTCHSFNLDKVNPSWQPCLTQAIAAMNTGYLEQLCQSSSWLPGPDKIFNAFTLPVNKVNYVLLGESPYPRPQSANGYAFWDAAVTNLWSETGLSKSVNRATSLRNIIKMLLVANGALSPYHTSQTDILRIDKSHLIKTNQELFTNFLQKGFLLLNTSLVLQSTAVRKDAIAWLPFLQQVLQFLQHKRPQIKLILFGNIASAIDKLIGQQHVDKFYAEHPYNISFIHNPLVLDFFRPLGLLNSP